MRNLEYAYLTYLTKEKVQEEGNIFNLLRWKLIDKHARDQSVQSNSKRNIT